MPPKYAWVWKAYLFVFSLLIIKKIYALLVPEAPAFLYYFVLRTFDPAFYAVYIAHVIQVLLSIAHWIPLLLYIYRIRFLQANFWKGLFVLRCLFEITGHSYEMNSLISLYHREPKVALAVFTLLAAPYIPSYLASYWYAFQQEKSLNPLISPKSA